MQCLLYALFFQNSSCSCPSDLWTCDPTHGCVCPSGLDCGIEEVSGEEVVVDYIKSDDDSSNSGNTGIIVITVVSLVIVGSIISCLIIVYYRYQLRLLFRDIEDF